MTENELIDADLSPSEKALKELKKDLRRKKGKWYIVQTYSGHEKQVKSAIETKCLTAGAGKDIYEICVPSETIRQIRGGQYKLIKRVRIPGYILIRMRFNEDSWELVRRTPSVARFCSDPLNPVPLKLSEVYDMLKVQVSQEAQAEAEKLAEKAYGGRLKKKDKIADIPVSLDLEVGESITIKEGSFAGLPGVISEINPSAGKLICMVTLFERETPVELSFKQVTKQI